VIDVVEVVPFDRSDFLAFLLVVAFPVSFLFGLYVYKWLGGGK